MGLGKAQYCINLRIDKHILDNSVNEDEEAEFYLVTKLLDKCVGQLKVISSDDSRSKLNNDEEVNDGDSDFELQRFKPSAVSEEKKWKVESSQRNTPGDGAVVLRELRSIKRSAKTSIENSTNVNRSPFKRIKTGRKQINMSRTTSENLLKTTLPSLNCSEHLSESCVVDSNNINEAKNSPDFPDDVASSQPPSPIETVEEGRPKRQIVVPSRYVFSPKKKRSSSRSEGRKSKMGVFKEFDEKASRPELDIEIEQPPESTDKSANMKKVHEKGEVKQSKVRPRRRNGDRNSIRRKTKKSVKKIQHTRGQAMTSEAPQRKECADNQSLVLESVSDLGENDTLLSDDEIVDILSVEDAESQTNHSVNDLANTKVSNISSFDHDLGTTSDEKMPIEKANSVTVQSEPSVFEMFELEAENSETKTSPVVAKSFPVLHTKDAIRKVKPLVNKMKRRACSVGQDHGCTEIDKSSKSDLNSTRLRKNSSSKSFQTRQSGHESDSVVYLSCEVSPKYESVDDLASSSADNCAISERHGDYSALNAIEKIEDVDEEIETLSEKSLKGTQSTVETELGKRNKNDRLQCAELSPDLAEISSVSTSVAAPIEAACAGIVSALKPVSVGNVDEVMTYTCADQIVRDQRCFLCFQAGEDLLACAKCPRVFHCLCLIPPLNERPQGDWYCRICCLGRPSV